MARITSVCILKSNYNLRQQCTSRVRDSKLHRGLNCWLQYQKAVRQETSTHTLLVTRKQTHKTRQHWHPSLSTDKNLHCFLSAQIFYNWCERSIVEEMCKQDYNSQMLTKTFASFLSGCKGQFLLWYLILGYSRHWIRVGLLDFALRSCYLLGFNRNTAKWLQYDQLQVSSSVRTLV